MPSHLLESMAAARPTRRIFCAALGATLVPAAGCTRRLPPPVPPTPSAPEIVAAHRGTWSGKGTMYYFDIELRNPAPAPRWMIFPSTISVSATLDMRMGTESVAAIYTYRLSERPRAILVNLLGPRMFAVRLPAHGRLMLRRLGIRVWGEGAPFFVDLDLLIARGMDVGGAPIAQRIGEDPVSESGGDVEARASAGHPGFRKAWEPPEGAGRVPVDVDVESHVRVQVELRETQSMP